ncbi:MAG: hypothetical protein AAF088_07390 [Pseudomonadota bacterium]
MSTQSNSAKGAGAQTEIAEPILSPLEEAVTGVSDTVLMQTIESTTLADGTEIATWIEFDRDAEFTYTIKGQFFDENGNLTGEDFAINSSPTYGANLNYEITPLSDGGFIAGYNSENSRATSLEQNAQIFDASGEKVGEEFQVNSSTAGTQQGLQFTELDNGNIMAVWNTTLPGQPPTLRAQTFTAEGDPVGGEFQLATENIGGGRDYKNLTDLTTVDGGFIAAYTVIDQFGGNSDADVVIHRFDNEGNTVGEPFVANQTINSWQADGKVAVLPDGTLAVAWEGQPDSGSAYDINDYDVFVRHFAADGTPLGDEIQVNPDSAGIQYLEGLEVQPDGSVAVIFNDKGPNGEWADQFATGEDVTATYAFGEPTPSVDPAPEPVAAIAAEQPVVEPAPEPVAEAPVEAPVAEPTPAVVASIDLANAIVGTDGRDNIRATRNDDTILGEAGNDNIRANKGDDTVFGGEGNDRLNGQRGDDVLDGGAGDDMLIGDHGSDIMTGGDGADTFFVKARQSGTDVITDFEVGTDFLKIDGKLYDGDTMMELVDQFGTETDDGIMLELDGNSDVMLEGIFVDDFANMVA